MSREMTDAMLRGLILSDLIQGCQDGRLTRTEKDRAIWLLNATDWKIQNVVGLPTDFLAKLLSVCPLLRPKSAEGVTPARTTTTPTEN